MKIEFYDTTLRDGAQAEGISYSVADKKQIFGLLCDFGIDLVEGGDPASNPKDAEFLPNAKTTNSWRSGPPGTVTATCSKTRE